MKNANGKLTTALCLLFCLFFLSPTSFGQDSSSKQSDIRTAIHLLAYMATDYSGAVKDGKILAASEYAEQKEFCANALAGAQRALVGNDSGAIVISRIKQLQSDILQKKDAVIINKLSTSIKNQIIRITGFKVSPTQWPDLAKGRQIFLQNCAVCHGKTGAPDAKLLASLDPPPANLTDTALMNRISPLQIYNTVRLGVTGTAMAPFTQLSDNEVWDVSFYAENLKYRLPDNAKNKYADLFKAAGEKVNLQALSTLSDDQLLTKYFANVPSPQQHLLSLRFHSESGSAQSLDFAKTTVGTAVSLYKEGKVSEAHQKALSAYLDGIEPVEAQLRNKSSKFTAQLESQMLALRTAIDKKKPVDQVVKSANASISLINKASDMLSGGKLTYWLAFLLSGSILLREGLEAFLIIAVMMALIKNTGQKKALRWVNGGWIIAVALGVAGWFASDLIINISGQNRELMEGVITLFAVAVLISVGFWLHSKSEAKHWQKFVTEKIGKLLQKESMVGLGLFAFMVVFREALEAILFIQAVHIDTPANSTSAIGFGVLTGAVVIAVLMILFLKFSSKIPIRPLFRYSSWMIVILAVILIGGGIHAIQEAGYFSVTPFLGHLRMEWLGIYPTAETLFPQIALILLVVITWYVRKRREDRDKATKIQHITAEK